MRWLAVILLASTVFQTLGVAWAATAGGEEFMESLSAGEVFSLIGAAFAFGGVCSGIVVLRRDVGAVDGKLDTQGLTLIGVRERLSAIEAVLKIKYASK